MIIRHEKPSDIETITKVTKAAFKDHPFSTHIEHLIIQDLRAADALTISLVTEIDGQVVGHIAFSPVTISDGTTNWYGLGPISVLPAYQGFRIGTQMVNNGLTLLTAMESKGCVLLGLPTYYNRFGFRHYRDLIHEGAPKELFVAKPFLGLVPKGSVEFHPAFKQLSVVEKDAIADVIIDYDIDGVLVDKDNKAIDGIIKKDILIEVSEGKFRLRPSILADYDTYFSKVAQFRATEMSRVHKNPILRAVSS
ncbi:MAG: N-acetyltransferase [Desulfobacterales bacterium]|nr:N-acetyltransferase [Desulfobacterales bacterium]